MTAPFIEIVGDRLRVNQHKGQRKAWGSQARFTFVIAGTQSGKTSWGPWWLHDRIAKHGPGDYLVVTATYDLFKLKLLPEMVKVFCQYLAVEGWKYSPSERVLINGKADTRIILRSAEADGGLESATAKAAWLDECGQDRFSLTAWEAVQRRLSLSEGPVLGTTTPYNLGWLKQQVYDKWRAGDKDYRVIQFKSTMNPMFSQAEYERARRTLPAWKFEMFYNGEFTRPAGMIYEDFTDLHKITPFDIPAEWPRYLGVDFGAIHTAKVWAAVDPETNFIYLYRAILEGNKTTAQHVKGILSHERLQGAFGGAASEKQQRMDWAAEGLYMPDPTITDVEAGIDRVIAALKAKRLYVFDTLTGLLDEFGTYSREVDEQGQPTEKIKNKNDYHYLDAVRYLICGYGDAGWLW